MRKLILLLTLTFIMCSGCVEAVNEKAKAKAKEQAYEVTEILDDNLYYIECSYSEIDDAIKWFDENYSVYKVNSIELKYVEFSSVVSVKGIYITTRRTG